jgi:hypothetical protein
MYSIDEIEIEFERLDNATEAIGSSLRRDGWDDEVKTSYFRYTSECRGKADEIRQAINILESACRTASNQDLLNKISYARSVCSGIYMVNL